MLTHRTQVRVRYGEVDQMGFLYYGNYGLYYEVGRAEMIREAGYPYSEMERDGIVMPVVKCSSKYLRPARYDELITIETTIREMHLHPFVTFHHRLFNEAGELIHTGEVTLTFFDPKTQKRAPMPERLRSLLEPHFPAKT
jgi:acyl-CoA thioester hydrolase